MYTALKSTNKSGTLPPGAHTEQKQTGNVNKNIGFITAFHLIVSSTFSTNLHYNQLYSNHIHLLSFISRLKSSTEYSNIT